MKYDISKAYAPKMPNLGNGTESLKKPLFLVSKDVKVPSFQCFSLYLAHTSAARNFHIPTSYGRKCAA